MTMIKHNPSTMPGFLIKTFLSQQPKYSERFSSAAGLCRSYLAGDGSSNAPAIRESLKEHDNQKNLLQNLRGALRA